MQNELGIIVKPEDRLAATLYQRAASVAQLVSLQEQVDVDNKLLRASNDYIEVLKREVDQLNSDSKLLYAKLKVLTNKIFELVSECQKPLRDDLRQGFPVTLRSKISSDYFIE